MDMERGCTPQKTEGRYHPNQSEAVVAVQMGDENMTQLREAHTTTTELHLGTLGTIEHQHLVTHLHHLRRRRMTKGGKRTSTP
jgi:hypothetical protein